MCQRIALSVLFPVRNAFVHSELAQRRQNLQLVSHEEPEEVSGPVRRGEVDATGQSGVVIPHLGEIDSMGQEKPLPRFAEGTLAPKMEFRFSGRSLITCSHIESRITVNYLE